MKRVEESVAFVYRTRNGPLNVVMIEQSLVRCVVGNWSQGVLSRSSTVSKGTKRTYLDLFGIQGTS